MSRLNRAKLLWRRASNRLRKELGIYAKRSYAQCGEDLIVRLLFDVLQVATPSYLDIGAHHPHFFSNTQLFYESGSRGVNVEPDPKLYRRICRYRKRDVNLMLGVGPQAGELELFIMSVATLNTFSAAEAAEYEKQGFKIVDRQRVKVVTPRELIDRYCPAVPDFVSIDVEGLDYAILESFDFSRHRPAVLCVESLSFSTTGEGRKNDKMQPLLESKGYALYADTYINSIYVDESRWRKRQS